MMAATDRDDAPTGEERLKKRRAAFWRFTLAGMAVALVLGFASGWGMALVEEGALPPALILVAAGLLLAFFAWFTIAYFRRVDELDLLDNLWASMIALYFYVVALPIWNTLAHFELMPPVNHWIIYFGTFTVMLVAYGARKLRTR